MLTWDLSNRRDRSLINHPVEYLKAVFVFRSYIFVNVVQINNDVEECHGKMSSSVNSRRQQWRWYCHTNPPVWDRMIRRVFYNSISFILSRNNNIWSKEGFLSPDTSEQRAPPTPPDTATHSQHSQHWYYEIYPFNQPIWINQSWYRQDSQEFLSINYEKLCW